MLPILAAPWFRYALYGVGVIVVLWVVRGYIYKQGFRACQIDQLQEVIVLAEKLAPVDHRLVATVAGTKEGVKHEIQAVPAVGFCGDDGLQFFNRPVEIIRAHSGEPPG